MKFLGSEVIGKGELIFTCGNITTFDSIIRVIYLFQVW
jgi:hypothetical protein